MTTMPQSTYESHCANNDGLCLACGEIQSGGCEPDMRDGECESCGEHKVVGFEEALVMGEIEFSEKDDDEE